MRLALGIVIGLGLWASGLRTADACGFWSMSDKERGTSVGYHINSATITRSGGRKARLGAFYLDEAKSGLRVVKDRKVVFDIKAGKILKRGKPIGSVDATGTVVLGKSTFVIELSNPHLEHDLPAWQLTVRRGTATILESAEASALCVGMHRDPPLTEAQQQDEVRRRVVYYLAWRETGP